MPSEPAWSDERLDTVLGNLLRGGVLLASAVVLLGGIVYVIHHGGEVKEYTHFGGPTELSTLPGIGASAFAGSGAGIIQLGLVLLIATPVARVVFSVIAFALQRDWTYIIVTLIVLAVLLFSLFGSG